MQRSLVVGVGTLVLVASLDTGCAGKVRNYGCGVRLAAESVDVEAIWTCNRGIVSRAVRGGKFSLREFRGAAEFFERITGVPADVGPSAVGSIPGADLEKSLAAWDDWHRRNRDRLYWDPEEGAVRVAAPTVGRQGG